MKTLLITGGRDYCEYLDANGFPIQVLDGRGKAIGIKTKDQAMDERRALGFALDFAFKWSEADRIAAADARGTGRWARVWADKRNVTVDTPTGAEPFAVAFACADPRAIKRLKDKDCQIFEVGK